MDLFGVLDKTEAEAIVNGEPAHLMVQYLLTKFRPDFGRANYELETHKDRMAEIAPPLLREAVQVMRWDKKREAKFWDNVYLWSVVRFGADSTHTMLPRVGFTHSFQWKSGLIYDRLHREFQDNGGRYIQSRSFNAAREYCFERLIVPNTYDCYLLEMYQTLADKSTRAEFERWLKDGAAEVVWQALKLTCDDLAECSAPDMQSEFSKYTDHAWPLDRNAIDVTKEYAHAISSQV